jgi:hypothetical protein
MDRGPAPQGLQDSAQSFNPGNPHNKRFALIRRYIVAPCWKNTRSAGLEVLKGREMRVPDEGAPVAAQRSECAIGTCDNWTVGPRFRLVRTFDLAPPSRRVALGGRFPGLKPWAEFCSPSGHKQGLSPRSVAYSLSEQIPERRPGYRASRDIA